MIIKINDYEHLNDVILENIEEINHWIGPETERYFIKYNGREEPFKIVWENHRKHYIEAFRNLEFHKMLTEKKNYLLELNFSVDFDLLEQEKHTIYFFFTIADQAFENQESDENKNESQEENKLEQ